MKKIRRRDFRVRVSFEVERHRGAERELGTLLEMSADDLLLRLPGPLPAKSELIRLSVYFPDCAIVVHAVAGRVYDAASGPLLECRTFALTGEERDIWERAILHGLAARARAA